MVTREDLIGGKRYLVTREFIPGPGGRIDLLVWNDGRVEKYHYNELRDITRDAAAQILRWFRHYK